MPLQPATKLGPYEIISALDTPNGTELDKASDTRLNREVANQVFDEHFSERFESGARAVAALDLDEAVTIGIAIADALDKPHREGLTHRDLAMSWPRC